METTAADGARISRTAVSQVEEVTVTLAEAQVVAVALLSFADTDGPVPALVTWVSPVGSPTTVALSAAKPTIQLTLFKSPRGITGKLAVVLALALFVTKFPIPPVLQLAVLVTAEPLYDSSVSSLELVQVPLPVSPLELDTLQPMRTDPTVPVAVVAIVVIVVQPAGKVGGVTLPERYANTSFKSPVAVALSVQLVVPPQEPVLAIAPHTGTAQNISSSSFLMEVYTPPAYGYWFP